jgi:hypothetical protein
MTIVAEASKSIGHSFGSVALRLLGVNLQVKERLHYPTGTKANFTVHAGL